MDYSELISSCKHVSNFQWVWRYNCLKFESGAYRFQIFVCGDG